MSAVLKRLSRSARSISRTHREGHAGLHRHRTASKATKNSLPDDSRTTSPSRIVSLDKPWTGPKLLATLRSLESNRHPSLSAQSQCLSPSVFSVANQRWLRSMAKSRLLRGLARGPGESRRSRYFLGGQSGHDVLCWREEQYKSAKRLANDASKPPRACC